MPLNRVDLLSSAHAGYARLVSCVSALYIKSLPNVVLSRVFLSTVMSRVQPQSASGWR